MKRYWKRILAAFLAISMIFGNSAPAYATEAQEVASFDIKTGVNGDGNSYFGISSDDFSDAASFEDALRNELDSQSATYDVVEITYPYFGYESATWVGAQTWCSAVDLLAGEDSKLIFNMESPMVEGVMQWYIKNARKVDHGICFNIYFSDAYSLETSIVNFPSGVDAYLTISMTDANDYADAVDRFGEASEKISLELWRGDTIVDNVKPWYRTAAGENSEAQIGGINVAKLESDTSYQLKLETAEDDNNTENSYKGTVYPWDEGSKCLEIIAGNSGFERLSDQDVMDILKNYEPGTFRQISIDQDTGDYKISKELANFAKDYLVTPSDGKDVFLRFGFNDEEYKYYYDYSMTNPGVQTEDQIVSAKFDVQEGKAPTVTFGSISLNAEEVYSFFNIFDRGDPSYYELTRAALGDSENVCLENTDSNVIYTCEEQHLYLTIYDINNLEPGVAYKIVAGEAQEPQEPEKPEKPESPQEPYTGSVSYDGANRWLSLYTWEADEHGFDLTDDQAVIDLLKQWKAAGEEFDAIEIYYPKKPEKISKDLWNTLRNLIREGGLERLQIIYDNQLKIENDVTLAGIAEFWNFYETKAATEDVVFSATIRKPSSTYIYSVDNSRIPADNVWMLYQTWGAEIEPADKGSEAYAAYLGKEYVLNMIPDQQRGGLYEYNPKTELYDLVEDTEFRVYCNPNILEENGVETIYHSVWTDSFPVSKLKANVNYKIDIAEYRGHVDEWEDEEGNVHRILSIHYGMDGKEEPFSKDELSSILKYHEDLGLSYDEINIEQPETSTNMVYADIAKRAAALMKTDAEGRKAGLRFTFWDEFGRFEWRLDNPASVPVTKDFGVDVKRNIDLSRDSKKFMIGAYAEDGTPYQYISQVMSADNVAVEIITQNYQVQGDAWIDYPEGQHLYDFVAQNSNQMVLKENPYVSLYGWAGDMDSCVGIEGFRNLELGKWYSLEKGAYIGNVWGDTLELYAEDLGKAKFTDADIQSIVQFYKEGGYTFDRIFVNQKHASTNIIDKDIINSLSSILNWDAVEANEDHELSMIFFFDTYSEYFQRSFCRLINPGKADKDINATLTLTAKPNQGVTAKLKKNTYNAKDVRIGIIAGEYTEIGKNLTAALGDAFYDPYDEGYYDQLYVLKKDTEFVSNASGEYRKIESGAEEIGLIYDFTIGNVQNLEGDVNYTFHSQNRIEEPFKVGMDVNLFNAGLLSEKALKGEKHTYKCVTNNTATVTSDGVLIPVNEGRVVFTVSYQYEGQTYLEVYEGYAILELQSISFAKSEISCQLYPGDVFYTSLQLKGTPLNYGLNYDKITWKSSNPTVATVDEYGNLEMLAEGTAIITATYTFDEEENRAPLSAACTVNVEELLDISEIDIPVAYAVTNFDTTLDDVELPAGWKWKDKDTNLNVYKDMEFHGFTAIYTVNVNGKTKSIEVPVDVFMVKLAGVNVVAVNEEGAVIDTPKYLAGSEDEFVVWNAEFLLEGNEDIVNGHRKEIEEKLAERIDVLWTAKGCDVTSEELEDYGEYAYKFTAHADNLGSKTFTATVVDTLAKNKKLFTDKESVFVVTANAEVAELGYMQEHLSIVQDTDAEGHYLKTGKIYFYQLKELYHALSFATSDKSVVKIDTKKIEIYEDELHGDQVMVTVLPYEDGKEGFAQITVSTKDKLKSSVKIEKRVEDYTAKILETAFEINKKFDADTTPVTIQFPENYMARNDMTLSAEIASEKYAELFEYIYEVETSEDDADAVRKMVGELKIVDDTELKAKVGKGTHQIPLRISYTYMRDKIEDGETVQEEVSGVFEAAIKVKVTDAEPKVTIKQTKKVNLFYTDHNRDGYLTVDTGKLYLESIEAAEDSGIMLFDMGDGTYAIEADETVTKNQKVELTYTLYDGMNGSISDLTKTVTVNVETKKPTIVLSGKTDTLYPSYGASSSGLYAVNKATGERILIEEEYLDAAYTGKNNYEVSVISEEIVLFNLTDPAKAVSGTDKFTFYIREDGWSDSIKATYSIKVNTAKPKIKLEKTKLTLNQAPEVMDYQMAVSKLSLNGYSAGFDGDVRFTGADANANAVLNKAITLEYNPDMGIVAKLHSGSGVELKNTTYKFNVWVANEYFETSTTLSVAIVNKTAASSVKVSKSGSIDVLLRDATAIIYKAKLSDLSGTVVYSYMEGKDADKFYQAGEGPELILKACYGEEFSTKATYEIVPVFVIVNEEGNWYEVKAPVQKVKVTQGKPKVTISGLTGNTLYQQHGNELKLNIQAALKNENIIIDHVKLLNYIEDLETNYEVLYDENGQEYGEISLRMIEGRDRNLSQINKSGKTWTLKFEVYYSDKAGNEKAATVNTKVVIK